MRHSAIVFVLAAIVTGAIAYHRQIHPERPAIKHHIAVEIPGDGDLNYYAVGKIDKIVDGENFVVLQFDDHVGRLMHLIVMRSSTIKIDGVEQVRDWQSPANTSGAYGK